MFSRSLENVTTTGIANDVMACKKGLKATTNEKVNRKVEQPVAY